MWSGNPIMRSTLPRSRSVGRSAVPRRCVARFPFDVAADTGPLVVGLGRAGDDVVHRGVEFLAGDRHVVARPGGVEPAPVDQLAVLVEQEEIRGTRGAVGERGALVFVADVWEGP